MGKKRPDKKTFCLTDEVSDQLEALADATGLNRSLIVRMAISNMHDFIVLKRYPDGLSVKKVQKYLQSEGLMEVDIFGKVTNVKPELKEE